MRDYARVLPKFWIGDTGKKVKKSGAEATVVCLYLMTSPHSNMLGLFYQPELLIAHETGLGFEGASKGLLKCIEAGFCSYDRESEMVWVFEMAKFQIAEKLSESDKRSIGVQNEYNQLPDNPFLASFFDRYAKAFNLTKKREGKAFELSPSEAPSKPHRSQEQEQEQEQEVMSGMPDDAKIVLDYLNAKANRSYQPVQGNLKLIVARLKEGSTVDQLKAVVDAKVRDWQHDPKMREYLRPATLFNAEKCGQYVGALGAGINGSAGSGELVRTTRGDLTDNPFA
ncbi:conserved phage C-terminal domain-containing protein [Burkholderia gladioli]|uniref:conserved phage C-terminal domain-containing protein n=1 Tax=Burkholderia gladioli TaxID=28095 RepID=UPI00069A295F|nr:conserved phage C-terminal domain-containing protein [Burkholderia gladioli]